MPCHGPLQAFYAATVNPTGRRSLVFDKRKSHSGIPIEVPCGQCIGCRLEKARQWAVRITHEQKINHLEGSAFVTLTYSDENLPSKQTLVKPHLQKFMKRLRWSKKKPGLRFFACGEYGEKTQRPHYHVLLLNCSFPDQKYFKKSDSGENLFVSAELSDLWPSGHHSIGGVTFESASYVAGYVCKKVTGKNAASHYGGRLPEFSTMSTRPGLGMGFLEKYAGEIYRDDYVISRGHEAPVPRYYDTKIEKIVGPNILEPLKVKRRRKGRLTPVTHAIDVQTKKLEGTSRRRRTREIVTEGKMARFKREI